MKSFEEIIDLKNIFSNIKQKKSPKKLYPIIEETKDEDIKLFYSEDEDINEFIIYKNNTNKKISLNTINILDFSDMENNSDEYKIYYEL